MGASRATGRQSRPTVVLQGDLEVNPWKLACLVLVVVDLRENELCSFSLDNWFVFVQTTLSLPSIDP